MKPDEQTQDIRPGFDDVIETLKVLAEKESESHWDSGDLAAAWLSQVKHGERESELGRLAQYSGYEYGSLRERVDCATFYPQGLRYAGMSWSHHNRARRGHELRHALLWLERANEEMWSVRDMEKAIAKEEGGEPPAPEPPALKAALLQIGDEIADTMKRPDAEEVIEFIRAAKMGIAGALSHLDTLAAPTQAEAQGG